MKIKRTPRSELKLCVSLKILAQQAVSDDLRRLYLRRRDIRNRILRPGLHTGRSSWTAFHKAGGEYTVSPKICSLAFDETMKELENHYDGHFEPELKVIVNAHYSKSSFSQMASDDVIQVNGRITVSF